MTTLALSRQFCRQKRKLDTVVLKKVDQLVLKFFDDPHRKGINLEPYVNAADPRARTARVDDNWRAILIDAGDDRYILHAVLKHDDADRWMMNNTFGVNAATGVVEVVDVGQIRAAIEPSTALVGACALSHRSEKDLRQLGVSDADVIRLVLQAKDETDVRTIANLLPVDQGIAVEMLLDRALSVDDIYSYLIAELDVTPPRDGAQSDDLGAALGNPANSSHFLLVDGADELEQVLARDFEEWEVFLHPSQLSVAYKPDFNGPARITGGPGTGKTVALLHRAVFLAKALPESSAPILVTTYTRKLADDLRRLLVQLGGPDILEKVDVFNLDKVAYEQYTRVDPAWNRTVQEDEAGAWRAAAAATDDVYSADFLRAEYEHVILSQGIAGRDEYLRAPRTGRGVRLDRRGRVAVWRAVEDFEQRTLEQGQLTFLQLAAQAADRLVSDPRDAYSHVLVDEAQDLHPVHWRMLRAIVPRGPNDLFIAGDAHQRIYDRYVTLKSVGIDVVGRSRRLRINYRTTEQIMRWSLALLHGNTFDDLDGGTDSLLGYRSEMHGDDPIQEGFATATNEDEALVRVVRGWMDDGVSPEHVGICARTWQRARAAQAALTENGIAAGKMDSDEELVRVGTMHMAKGLEFRCVAIVGVDDGVVPLASQLTPVAMDPLAHRADRKRERCLLYVAASRPRERLYVSWAGTPSEFLRGEE